MKRLALLLTVILMSCSSDSDELPDRDVLVFQSTTFVSDSFEVEKEDVMGVEIEGTESRRNVIRFKPNGNIEYFQVDEFNDIQGGTRSTTGNYKLDFPKVYDILAVHIFDETQLTIQTGSKMRFSASGKTYTASLEQFD